MDLSHRPQGVAGAGGLPGLASWPRGAHASLDAPSAGLGVGWLACPCAAVILRKSHCQSFSGTCWALAVAQAARRRVPAAGAQVLAGRGSRLVTGHCAAWDGGARGQRRGEERLRGPRRGSRDSGRARQQGQRLRR